MSLHIMNKSRLHTRRQFLTATASAAASLPILLPSLVRSAETSPGGRLTMGFIGMGTQSRGLLGGFLRMETRVLAVCDVDTTRRMDAKQKVDQG